MYEKLNLMLGLAVNSPELDEEHLNRGIFQATAILSRFFPRELIYSRSYNLSISAEAFTSPAANGTYVTLGNKPIKHSSETVTRTSSGTEYTRDTDYEMDYINGKITTLSGGSMSTSTAHLVSYEMDSHIIDITSALTEPIEIVKVDVLTANETPIVLEGFNLWGDFLDITQGFGTQSPISDNALIRIYYHAHHTEPDANDSGSWPRYLDEVLLIGASGYALLMESVQRMHQSVTDLATARTRLSSIAAVHTAVSTTLTNPITTEYTRLQASIVLANNNIAFAGTEYGLANSQFDLAPTPVTLANAEYDKVATEFAFAKTALQKAVVDLARAGGFEDSATADADQAATENAKVHTGTTGPIALANAELDKVDGILDTANTALDLQTVLITASSSDAETYLNAVNAELLKAVTALDNVDDNLDTDTRSAEKYLDLGDALINTINTGEDASNQYNRYAQTKINMATAFNQEAQGRVGHGNALIGLANGYINIQKAHHDIAISFMQEAERRLALAKGFHDESVQHINSASTYVQSAVAHTNIIAQTVAETRVGTEIADGFVSEGQGFITLGTAFLSEAAADIAIGMGYVSSGDGYIDVAGEYLSTARAQIEEIGDYIAQMRERISEMRVYVEEANVYQQSAISERESATMFRDEAENRIASFIQTLSDRRQSMPHRVTSSVRQYADYDNTSS